MRFLPSRSIGCPPGVQRHLIAGADHLGHAIDEYRAREIPPQVLAEAARIMAEGAGVQRKLRALVEGSVPEADRSLVLNAIQSRLSAPPQSVETSMDRVLRLLNAGSREQA